MQLHQTFKLLYLSIFWEVKDAICKRPTLRGASGGALPARGYGAEGPRPCPGRARDGATDFDGLNTLNPRFPTNVKNPRCKDHNFRFSTVVSHCSVFLFSNVDNAVMICDSLGLLQSPSHWDPGCVEAETVDDPEGDATHLHLGFS